MSPVKLRPRKTVEDYLKLPEGTLAELIDGEILLSTSPKSVHQKTVAGLFRALDAHVRKTGLGRFLFAPLDVHLPSGDVLQPDLIFIATAHEKIVEDWIRGVPDLLIEVISPDISERDLLVKRALYAKNGVPEYWLVDPRSRSVEVLIGESGKYVTHGYFEEGDAVTSPILAGLSLPPSEIFA
jgi:Uma2 family endonuclease